MDKALLFDLDGVLIDSEEAHFESHRRALEKFGISLSIEDYFKKGLSRDPVAFYLEMAQLQGAKNFPVEEARSLKKEIFKTLYQKIVLNDGVKELLEASKGNFRIGLVTASSRDYAKTILESTGIWDFFEIVVSGRELTNSKPHPEPYLRAISLLKVKPGRCIAFEDSSKGILSAKSAGTICVAYETRYGKYQDLSCADLQISDFRKIDVNFLKSLIQENQL